ncbi:MAG: hypothetical protein ACFCVF_03365, partial [Kineosporiaceae bacterium]
AGARRYGVVLHVGDGDWLEPPDEVTVDAEATAALRAELAAARPDPLPIFDSGPPLAEILANAEAETGLPAPKPPVAL